MSNQAHGVTLTSSRTARPTTTETGPTMRTGTKSVVHRVRPGYPWVSVMAAAISAAPSTLAPMTATREETQVVGVEMSPAGRTSSTATAAHTSSTTTLTLNAAFGRG